MSNPIFIDCPTGIAGDMLLAGFLDLGVPEEIIKLPLASLGLENAYQMKIMESKSNGFRGLKVSVEELDAHPSHRKWRDIKKLIEESTIEPILKSNIFSVFLALAEAEAYVHGVDVEQVHFHEVGAIDSLVDIVGVCAAINFLKPERIYCGNPPSGRGFVSTEHGLLPIPAPAVLALAKNHNIKLITESNSPQGELTTPTGLALMAIMADSYGPPPYLSISSFGIGLGHKRLDRPNFLRICKLDKLINEDYTINKNNLNLERVVIHEAWVDDKTPQQISSFVDSLRALGAIDVITHSIQMKKNRNGLAIKALINPQDVERIRLFWFSEGITLGLREIKQERYILSRRIGFIHTAFGKLRAKEISMPDGSYVVKPEYDELLRISNKLHKSTDYVLNEVLKNSRSFTP
tara:strand:- start:1471 stop:2688 length:1218 start_codon:yes stop_codon:yes gene_type:complete